jgi:protein MpaA
MEDLYPTENILNFPADGVFRTIGSSRGGHEIKMIRIGDGPKNVLVLGGVHGDEPEGIRLVNQFVDFALKSFREPNLSLFIIPVFNEDGARKNERCNSNGVDLNRNLPTKDWSPIAAKERYFPGPHPNSEPENQLLVELLDLINPVFILSAHSWINPMICTNGDCKGIPKAMRDVNDLIIQDDIGYPTPGSLGTYTGWERNIPTITLEVLEGDDPERVWLKQRGALLNAFRLIAKDPEFQPRS